MTKEESMNAAWESRKLIKKMQQDQYTVHLSEEETELFHKVMDMTGVAGKDELSEFDHDNVINKLIFLQLVNVASSSADTSQEKRCSNYNPG